LLFEYGHYETELQLLMGCMELDGTVCLDIGANIGVHTLAMSRLAGSAGKVFAFEPEAHNFRLLEHNLRLNGSSNVVAQRCAVGAEVGFCRMAVNRKNYGDHRIVPRDRPPTTDDRPPTEDERGRLVGAASGVVSGRSSVVGPADGPEVSVTTIDAALREVREGAIRLIKIDVQGYECHVVEGMCQTLERHPETVVILEIFPDALRAAGRSAVELMQSLRDLGLTGWEFHPHRIIPLSEPWVYDLIRDGTDVNVILCRNGERLRAMLDRFYGRPLHG
jgi:FkbM family methyltransferase